VADSYEAYYAKYVPPGGVVDVIGHTGFIYLVGRDGQYIGFFPPGTSADRLLEIIRPYLARHQVGQSRAVGRDSVRRALLLFASEAAWTNEMRTRLTDLRLARRLTRGC
jgi:hypothetical protein